VTGSSPRPEAAPEPDFWLGARRDTGETVTLPAAALLRHAIALGSSGSGKTVFCKVIVEEAIRRGVPVIAIDPQGDLASLALGPPAEATDAAAQELRARADVVVFTPASRKGVPLCADPVSSGANELAPDERAHAITRTASRVTALLGYDLDGDEGAGVRAVLDQCLAEMLASGRPARSLGDLMAYLDGLGDGLERYARFLDPKRIRAAIRRAARLDVGARRLLFHDGVPIDIDVLLGRTGPAATPPGKVRVAVIYLNTLHAAEDKEFIVGAIADRLYAWMLREPSSTLQALFYIDEIAPYLPPVKKPACKEDLELLFKQARKFGVGCLVATQNPGDVDYKSLAQIGTWAIGRLATRQDQKKIEPAVRSLAHGATDALVAALPGLKPGELVLLSPDHFPAPCPLATRRLVTAHQTLDEERIETLARARWHDRFAAHEPPRTARTPVALDATLPAWAAPVTRDDAPATRDDARATRDDAPLFELPAAAAPAAPAAAPAPRSARRKRAVKAAPAAAPAAEAESGSGSLPREEAARLAKVAQVLGAKLAMTTDEVARKAGVSVAKARALLRHLVAGERAGEFRDGRTAKYWLRETGARPDLGMKARVTAALPLVDRGSAEAAAQGMLRSKILGFIGENEAFEEARMVHRLLYRVGFEERIKTGLLARMVGPSHEQRLGNLYLHPRSLAVLAHAKQTGLHFIDELPAHASEVPGLDGIARFVEVAPGELSFDEDEWRARRPLPEVKQHLRRLFRAKAGAVTPVFIPVWKLVLRRGAAVSFRVVLLDALVGGVIDWP
jgi:hypothetical protein